MEKHISHLFQRRQLRIDLIGIFVTVTQLARPQDMPKFELDQTSFLSSIFPTVSLVLILVAPFRSEIRSSPFFHWLIDCCSTSSLSGLIAMPFPIKSLDVSIYFLLCTDRSILISHVQLYLHLQCPPHPTPESTLSTTPNPTPLDVPVSQRPHPTYAEKSRAVYQSRQAAKIRLDALNAPAAVRYRESRGHAVQAIFRRNNEMSAVDRKAFERRRDDRYKVWGMRRLSPLRNEIVVSRYDDLGQPRYQGRFTFPEREDWRSFPARVPLHANLWSSENNGKWGPKRSSQTPEELARDLPRVRPIPKLVRLGFVDLGPPSERKRFPLAMEVYLASCKIRARRVFRFRDDDTVQLAHS